MTKPSLILGVAAAFALSILPLAASAGTFHSGYRPGHWQRSHDGQGVMRVYGSDAYRTPEAYVGGEFRSGLDVQTAREDVEYQDEYYETSDRYARTAATPCHSVCVAAYAPPPPPPCVTQIRREARYAAPRVTSRQAVIEVEEGVEEHSDYYRETSDGGVYHRSHAYHDDCPCRQGHDDRDAGYDDRYDDHYDDRRDDRYDDRYDGYRDEGRDVFGRY